MKRMAEQFTGRRIGLWFIIAILATLLACSCTTTRYVPVESVRMQRDTIRQTQLVEVRDTIRERIETTDTRYDSIAPILDSLGRVVGLDRWHFRQVARTNDTERRTLLARIDSLQKSREIRDTIREPYPVETVREVARKQTWWQTSLQCLGASALLALLACAVWKVKQKRDI